MKKIFIWGTLRHNGVNNPFFLANARLVCKHFVFEDTEREYMKFGDIYEVTKEELKELDDFEADFGYRRFYNAKYNFYYYVGADVSKSGIFK